MREANQVLDLLDRQGLRLRNLLFKVTLSEDAADDLMQELFLRLARSGGFARSEKPEAYAWRTALNLALEHVRRRRPSGELAEGQAVSPAEGALGQLIADEQLGLILREVMDLRPPGREIVVMRFLEQREYGEISEILGMSENHIRSRLSKSLARLRGKLNGQLGF